MEIKLTLVITERGRQDTHLGWERVDIIDFGYSKDGELQTVLCIGEYSSKDGPTGTYGIFPVTGDDIFEDLFMNYNVAMGE
jgi:hypothetical protein